MTILNNLVMLNRGNGTTFIDVQNGDAAGTNVNSPVATTGDGGEDGMTYNGTSNYTTMPALSSYSFLTGRWTLAVRAKFATETTNDAAISFGASGGNANRLWLGVNGNDAPRVRVRNSALTNLEVTGSLSISNTQEIVLIAVGKDKLDDGDYTNGTVILYDSAGNVLASGDYDLTTLSAFAKHAIGGDVTSSYGGGIDGDVFWSAAWNRALSVSEIQQLDDSPYPFASRSITNIDTDNDVQAGQSSVTVTTVGLDASPTTKTATLGGESLTVISAGETSWTVDIPLHINLEWGSTTNDLVLTDDTGSVTLNNVTLSAPTGWETVTFTSAPDAGTTESFYEYAQTDADVGNFTAAVNDILAFESQSGLTVDSQTIPTVSPPATVTGDYKWWDVSLSTWTNVSSFTITDGGIFGSASQLVLRDILKPVLKSPLKSIFED